MSENCNHDCDSCKEECKDRQSFKVEANANSKIKKVYAVVSGKGGVGKSMVTTMLSILSERNGNSTAVLDADVTGPSIPKAFGIKEKAMGNDLGILPALSKCGIKIMSVNLLLENDTDPVIWRGPILANTVKQFWTDVVWGDVDYMFVDMPPGTGDVPLTVFQSLPIDGIIIVTSPQELVSMIVEKAVKMAEMMNIPVVGIVENMAYFECPDCHNKHYIFGESKLEEIAKTHKIKNIARIPIDTEIAKLADDGKIEDLNETKISEFKELFINL